MSLAAYQLSYNGLTFGAGTDVQLVSAYGLRALPGIRSSDVARPRADGSFAGLNFLDERIVTLNLLIAVTTTNPWETVLENVHNAFLHISNPAALLPLAFYLPGWAGSRQVTCRPSKGVTPISVNYSYHYAELMVELTCPDPLVYDATAQSASTGLPNPTAGAAFPWSFPLSWGASSGGALNLSNIGNYNTPIVFTIAGPCTNPQIVNAATGQTLSFAITLANTDSLVVDTGAHTVTLNGTANRYNTLNIGSQWFTCPPGSLTVNFLSGDATLVAGTLTAAWSNAWAWI